MPSLTLAISGAGGAGAISTGEMLLRLAARLGYYGMLKKTFSPQIRGGEAASILRLGDSPVTTFDDHVDLLVALDWINFSRFADEIPLTERTLIIQESSAEDIPDSLSAHPQLIHCEAGKLASEVESSWVNLVFMGLLAAALGSGYADALEVVRQRLHKYEAATLAAAVRALRAGYDAPTMQPLNQLMRHIGAARQGSGRLLASGNQMAALGALEAGVRFVAAYPITPASDLLEWIAGHIESRAGHLVQAEDELAAINMTIGAAFGGVPAMTATSGPGLALMSEAMGLAVASETPVVVVDVMRGGPSTGIPTKSEQSDFNLAVYGLHGDAPHIVLACQSVADCCFTTAWAVELSTRLQTLVIVLSDQFLGQSLQVLDALPSPLPRAVPSGASEHASQPYLRYANTASGISPMALPGEADHMYTADGLEHQQNAIPSPRAADHQQQLDKRRRKLAQFDFGDHWAEYEHSADSDSLLICWGSVSASSLEARQRLRDSGKAVSVLSLRLLAPLPLQRMRKILATFRHLLVIEQNHTAQSWHYLRSLLPEYDLASLARPGPLPITASEIIAALEKVNGA